MSEDATPDRTGDQSGVDERTADERTADDRTADERTADERTADERLARLADRDGWHVEGSAARVHYEGEGDRYGIEYYAPSDCVVYWKVPPADGGETAVPVGRSTVPTPLRERIRMDLEAAGVDPEVEQRSL